jgi:sec-independent protein translocase protein TatA
MDTITLAFFENLFRGPDLLILLVLGLLIFGKRLPEVGRGLGRGIVEFRKGLKGVEDDIEKESDKPTTRQQLPPREPEARPPVNSAGEDVRVSRNPNSGQETAEASRPHE